MTVCVDKIIDREITMQKMNIKTMRRDEWSRILKKKVIIREFAYGNVKGKVSLLKIHKVSEPLWVGYGTQKVKIADENHSWVQLALENGYFWITAMFDEKDQPFEIYIDMTDGNHTQVDNPYFEDMYLDYAISGDMVLELDRDELDEAFRERNITKERYERTLSEGEKLFVYLKNHTAEVKEFIQKMFLELKEEIGGKTDEEN
jgi:predicted RNA-binding protein associated with RNAse of E/G family